MTTEPEAMRVPYAYRAMCQLCGEQLDTRATGVHQYMEGWVKNRQAGGGNAIAVPIRRRMWAHGRCVKELAAGRLQQGTLL